MRGETVGSGNQIETHELHSDKLIVEGGISLDGSVRLQGAKNLALQAIISTVLVDGEVTLENVPRIADVETVISGLRDMGTRATWMDEGVLTCDSRGIKFGPLDPVTTLKTTGSRYFIPVLARRFGRVITGPSGGDQLGGGDRGSFSAQILRGYEQLGLGHYSYLSTGVVEEGVTRRYEFFPLTHLPDRGLIQQERFFGPTIQALLYHVKGTPGEEFIIRKPCVEPEIFQTIDLLNSMGAEIEYQGDGQDYEEDFIRISSVDNLKGARFRIASDPNVLVAYTVLTIITNGRVVIGDIDHSSKVEAFLRLLSQMNANYAYDPLKRELQLLPSLTQLRPVNLETYFWPGATCHTDWQPILTALLVRIKGVSFIDENVHPQRFSAVDPLAKMGGKFELIKEDARLLRRSFMGDHLPHSLKINGGIDFRPGNYGSLVDNRAAVGVLAAMLSAKGKSTLEGAGQIQRGMENIVSNLRSLGARVSFG
ncbi:hypothetical protein HYZ70_03750 [Candidatus Curtissbacteria bacterium]|nr:hypothetical protein [Candidatus Curtissbacteria bacterium]